MKTLILAAGRATRLLPLTKDKHQCMLKVNNKTILERQLNLLKEAGAKDVTVITGYHSAEPEILCSKLRVKTLFNPFYAVSGMALSLWIAKEELKGGFLIIYSDVLCDAGIIKKLLLEKGDICLAIKKDGLREEAEKVIESAGLIKSVTKSRNKEENGEFIGIAKLSPVGAEKLLDELNKMTRLNLDISLINCIDNLIKSGEVVTAFDIEAAKFIDIDFPEDLERAKMMFN